MLLKNPVSNLSWYHSKLFEMLPDFSFKFTFLANLSMVIKPWINYWEIVSEVVVTKSRSLIIVYSEATLFTIMHIMAAAAVRAHNQETRATFVKFSTKEMLYVSLHPALKSALCLLSLQTWTILTVKNSVCNWMFVSVFCYFFFFNQFVKKV